MFVSLPIPGTANRFVTGALLVVFDRIRGEPGSIVLVVPLLTVLMKDQVALFTSKGLAATFLGEE